MYLDQLMERYSSDPTLREVAASDPFQPCTEGEMRAFEERNHLTLPAAYREFLLWAGHGGGYLLRAERATFELLQRNQRDAAELLRDDDVEPLPPDAVVFYMHDFYEFCFFRTSEGDNPPVYYYVEARLTPETGKVVRMFEHFSDFLPDWIDSAADWWMREH